MSLQAIALDLQDTPIPEKIGSMLTEAERRCDAFFDAGLDRRYPRYLPSNPTAIFQALTSLQNSHDLRGDLFCEWGSGFGIATCMAALMGFTAYGIEIEDGLADLSTQLAADLGIPIEILCTSYLPEGYEECEGVGGKDLLAPEATSSGGEAIDTTPIYDGLDPDDVDLFFVYPWPGQEEFMMDLFQAIASEDAILLIYHADGEPTAYRQVIDEDELFS